MTYPKGKFVTEIQSPFTTYFDVESMTIDESPYFMVTELKPRDWVESVYGKAVPDAAKEEDLRHPYSRFIETIAYTNALSGIFAYTPSSNNVPRLRIRRLWRYFG